MKKITDLANGELFIKGIGLSLLAVVSITPFLLSASAEDYYTSNAQPYGIDSSLNESEIRDLPYLDFSNGQSYNAIKNRFGYPAMRSSTSDFYLMPNGHYTEVVYNSSNTAIALRLGDSN